MTTKSALHTLPWDPASRPRAQEPRPRLSSEPLLVPTSSCWDCNSLGSQQQRAPDPHLTEGKLSLGGERGGAGGLAQSHRWSLVGTGSRGTPPRLLAHSPRDFIPMKRFSTMSMRPTPCLPLGGERATRGQVRPQAWCQMPPTGRHSLGTRGLCPPQSPMQDVRRHLRTRERTSELGDLVLSPSVQVGKLRPREGRACLGHTVSLFFYFIYLFI